MPAVRRPRLLTVAILAATLAAFPLGTMASHDFLDVPNSNPFHADISALAASGVTTGCGGGNYCPSAFVTREQMAAFMNRLGALAPGKVPVVNADRLDGLDSADLLLNDGTIPSGTTVTGAAIWDGWSVADNGDLQFYVELPARAPVNLTDATVNFAAHVAAADDDATCTGSASAPTAPAGKVCIYIGNSLNVDGATGWVEGSGIASAFANRFFDVQAFSSTATLGADMFIRVTWAYTAP